MEHEGQPSSSPSVVPPPRAFDAERDLELMLDCLGVAACVITRDLTVVAWNRALADWSGIASARAIGTNLARSNPRLREPKYMQRLHRVFAEAAVATFDGNADEWLIPLSGRNWVTRVSRYAGQPRHALVTIVQSPDRFAESNGIRASRPGDAQVACADETPRLDCRVLVVDDGPDNQRLFQVMLQKAGARVVLASDGAQAIAQVDASKRQGEAFDVILMDMQMPVVDGYTAAQALRQSGHRGPIIALTAHAMSGDRERCIAAGCDDYATKPIDLAALITQVHRYASMRQDASRSPAL